MVASEAASAASQSGFNNFLNFAVPFLIIVSFILFMWYKFREPLGKFYEWMKGMFSSGAEKTQNTIVKSREIVYDI
jgi:hypothetical protein